MSRPSSPEKPELQHRDAALLTSPALFLRDLDPLRGTAIFTPMTEASYRASSFLDNRIARANEKDIVTDLDDLLELAATRLSGRRIINYLFHIGHCGSTLVSRVLGERPCYLALREPPLLMGLSRSARALGRPGFPISHERWASLKELSLAVLAKTWRPDQSALVKPTSHAGNLIPTLMQHTGRERAIMLYLDLETFLATMLRPHTRRETRLYARDFRVRDYVGQYPGAPTASDAYDDGPLAAMSWLLHVQEMLTAADDPEIGSRCMFLHFDSFLADPRGVIERVCEFIGPAVTDEEWTYLRDGKLLSFASKAPDQPYTADDRRRELAASQSENAADIAAGIDWAAQVCRHGPFSGLMERFPPAREHRALP